MARASRGRALAASILAIAIAIACGPPADPPPFDCARKCSEAGPDRCFTLHRAAVVVFSPVAADPVYLDRAIARALEYWSAPADALSGWCLLITAEDVECLGDRCAGCCNWAVMLMQVKALDPRCPETAQLVHELGHVLHHDGGHQEPIWCWETEQEAIRNIVRAPDSTPACTASAFYTWRADFDLGCDGRGRQPGIPSQ